MPDLRQYEVFATTRAFQRHVDTAKRMIERAASVGRPVVSMSWGKDSCALGYLCHEVLGRFDIMHMACAHDLPGGEAVTAYFAQRATVHELPPLNALAESLEWLKIVGLPHERDHKTQQKIIQTRKRSRGQDWALDNGYACTLLGMRAQESATRRHLFKARGPIYQRASGHWMCNPIAWWTAQDVWALLVSRGVPWHPMYDCETHGFTRETIRNGGWLYTDGADRGWVAWLWRHYRPEYERLVAAFPHMAALM
jgi:3'-phosphoadenosine 5'-phosphosulfate sulfotransferase (PAPS reductase)/FAD synthetase